MTPDHYEIRDSADKDLKAIGALYRAALPGEDLSGLLSELLANRDDVLSLVAVSGNDLIGHVAFAQCHVAGGDAKLALLGPLAVQPAQQQQGIGSAIVREGLRRLRDDGVSRVLVLGDPAYYGRHGFSTETDIQPPYPLVPEYLAAWQSLALAEDAAPCRGQLVVPAPWMRPALWGP